MRRERRAASRVGRSGGGEVRISDEDFVQRKVMSGCMCLPLAASCFTNGICWMSEAILGV